MLWLITPPKRPMPRRYANVLEGSLDIYHYKPACIMIAIMNSNLYFFASPHGTRISESYFGLSFLALEAGLTSTVSFPPSLSLYTPRLNVLPWNGVSMVVPPSFIARWSVLTPFPRLGGTHNECFQYPSPNRHLRNQSRVH